MNYFCYQGNDHDCGFASLKMLLASLSHNHHYLNLKKKTKKEAYTFSDLVQIAAENGIKLNGWNIRFDELSEIKLPCLVLLKGNHLVLLKKISKKKVHFNDPGKGKITMSHEDFAKIFEEKALIADGKEKPFLCREKNPKIVPIKYTISHLLIGVISSALLMLDFYFMKDHENIVFVIVFLGLFILAELVENWYMFKIINYFDNQYLSKFFARNIDKNPENYQKYLNLKTSYFSSRKSSVLFGSFAVVFIVILAINDLKNLIVLGTLATYKILELFICQKGDQSTMDLVTNGESKAFDNPENTVSELRYINDIANGQTLKFACRKCIYTFVMFLLALFMMVINNQISVNYAVFHFGMYFIIGQGLEALFSYVSFHNENKKQIAQFIDKCDL